MTEIRIPSEGQLHPLTGDKGEPSPIRFAWIYKPERPFSAFVEFQLSKGETVTWEFARELVIDALAAYQTVGRGDVLISHACMPHGDDLIVMHLTSPDGEARISASDVPARHWLVQSYALVPKGCEDVRGEIDAAIAACLRLEAS